MTDESLFAAALALPPADRPAFLDRACAADADLRRQVDDLLAAHAASNPLDHPPAELARTGAYHPEADGPSAAVGDRVGPYKLLEKIGEGGMGEVWVADQHEPIKRRVAVKLIKPGMDSRSVLARFEAERQALAVMDHPNIAKVLDAGTNPDGRPFFVMELVKGTPITEFCDARRLSPRERLELFVPVCQAIQHAHTKGIIHRDIKPSNVLVALHDERPVPKVIDFGVAKAVGQQLTEKTIYTGFGALVGTPAYMAPEQATFNQLDVDTRADVYALGVLLYELLAGSPPVEPDRLRKAALDEVLRIVRDEEPPRPSQRLSTSQARASIAAVRQTDPAGLSKLMRGELDWIVMKALEKDRNRRYETATGLAADVQRYLTGEAVQAHPPTLGYRVRKAYRRNQAAVLVCGAFVGLLVAAAAAGTWLAVKANRAEATADAKRREVETNAKEAEANAEAAKKNSEWAEANERALWKTYDELADVNFNNQMRILGLQVDLDLAESRTDPRVGLLRLAHPLKDTWERKVYFPNSTGVEKTKISSDYPPFRDLRQFVAAAVLVAGQDYAPLLPPVTHDGRPVTSATLSPDNRALLTLGADRTARLSDTRTARQIALLRKGDEDVVNGGFSPDGLTAFTDDRTSVARFWDVPGGRFRAATEPRQNRYDVPAGWLSGDNSDRSVLPTAAQLGANRLLTRTRVGKESGVKNSAPDLTWEGPVELWDTATGRLVARLDAAGRSVPDFRLLNDGRWVTTLEGRSTRLVLSADDGRLLARLKAPDGETFSHDGVDARPTGRHVATTSERSDGRVIRVWDLDTGQAQSLTRIRTFSLQEDSFRYWVDDPTGGGSVVIVGSENGVVTFYRVGLEDPLAQFNAFFMWPPDFLAGADDRLYSGNGWLFDVRTWQRVLPPPGRKFHPGLARFAPDGRFIRAGVDGQWGLIDTRTDKYLPLRRDWKPLSGFGWIACDGGTVRLIPSQLDFPADLLELWAQVAVRGQLDADGRFAKWDESTWEAKRQELAARKPPNADFPFPGHVAGDKLHWLRAEFAEAKIDADKLHLARKLLRLAEAAGDRNETVRWRGEVDQLGPPVAPPPREVKP